MVNQVQIVGILMIVQGTLAVLMGILVALVGPAMFAMMKLDPTNAPPAEAETLFTLLSVFYVVEGLLVFVAGVLNIIAGIRLLYFRGRTFAFVALFSNVVPMVTCYCAPTSIGVLVYGLIVLFNHEVVRAFAMAAAGVPPERIKARFAPRFARKWQEDDEEDDQE